jgi:hypothetical protein
VVLQIADEFRIVRGQLDRFDETVLEATAMWVIDMRDYHGSISFDLPGKTGADNFEINILFSGRVEDAVVVAQRSGGPIEQALEGYFRSNPELGNLASDYESKDIGELRAILNAEIKAVAQMLPPRIPGVEVSVSGLSVKTPDELEKFDTAVRDEVRKRKREKASSKFRRRQARVMEEFIEGDAAETARKIALLGVQHGEVKFSDVVEIQQKLAQEEREGARAQEELRVQFATELVKRGFFDRTRDAMALVDQLWAAGHKSISQDAPKAINVDVETSVLKPVPASKKNSISDRPVDTSDGLDDSAYTNGEE